MRLLPRGCSRDWSALGPSPSLIGEESNSHYRRFQVDTAIQLAGQSYTLYIFVVPKGREVAWTPPPGVRITSSPVSSPPQLAGQLHHPAGGSLREGGASSSRGPLTSDGINLTGPLSSSSTMTTTIDAIVQAPG